MMHLFTSLYEKIFLPAVLAVFVLPLNAAKAASQGPAGDALQTVFRDGAPGFNSFSGLYLQMTLAIVALSVVLKVFRTIQERRNNEPLEGMLHVANWATMLLLSSLELFYALAMGKDAAWFCNPYKAGWLWFIPGFVIFAWVVYNQLMCLANILADLQHHSRAEFSWKPGLYSWAGGLVCLVICQFFYQPGMPAVMGLILLAQLVQAGVIFKNAAFAGGLAQAVIFILVYLIGTFAMAFLLIHFSAMLVFAAVAAIVFMVLGSGDGSYSTQKRERPKEKCPYCGASKNMDGTYNCTCLYVRRKAFKD